MSYIFELIDKKLDGDFTRVKELFRDESKMDELIANAEKSVWYHFEPNTYDGIYFIKNGPWYTFYFQERGKMSEYSNFDSFNEGVQHFLTKTKLAEAEIKLKEKQPKKWWKFWA